MKVGPSLSITPSSPPLIQVRRLQLRRALRPQLRIAFALNYAKFLIVSNAAFLVFADYVSISVVSVFS